MNTLSNKFTCVNVGKGQIKLSGPVKKMRPVELYMKEDGAMDDKPSITIVMKDLFGGVVVGELTVGMLNEGLQEIGYRFTKSPDYKKLYKLLEQKYSVKHKGELIDIIIEVAGELIDEILTKENEN